MYDVWEDVWEGKEKKKIVPFILERTSSSFYLSVMVNSEPRYLVNQDSGCVCEGGFG